MANTPLKIVRGTTFEATFTIASNGTPYNLTGKTLVFHVLAKDEFMTLSTSDTAGVTGTRFYFTDAPNGIANLKISDEDTALFSSGGSYRWWIALTGSGDVTKIAGGTFNIAAV